MYRIITSKAVENGAADYEYNMLRKRLTTARVMKDVWARHGAKIIDCTTGEEVA